MKGYGQVFQNVMRNKTLSAESKAIYAYLSSLAGSQGTCCPSMDLMQTELGMSRNRLKKHMGQLIDFGIVKKTRQKNGNLHSGNTYKIFHAAVDFGAVENEPISGSRKVDFGAVENESTNNNSLNNNDLKKKILKEKAFYPPTADEVQAYCDERSNGIDAQHFIDFYASKGWMIGKNKMKDWKAAVRTWERNNGLKGGEGRKTVESNQKNRNRRSAADFYEQFLGACDSDKG